MPLEVLQEAIVAVGETYGERADCASAAALLKETARPLGYDLTERAVSMLICQRSSGDMLFMGPKATANLSPRCEPSWRSAMRATNNGHVILTCESPKLLIDANLSQLGAHGVPAPSIAIRISSTQPESGTWEARSVILTRSTSSTKRTVGWSTTSRRSSAARRKMVRTG